MLIILLTANTLQNPQIKTSRIVVYVNENLVRNVKEDLRSEDFSSVWIEIRMLGSKESFGVEYIIYRDHHFTYFPLKMDVAWGIKFKVSPDAAI